MSPIKKIDRSTKKVVGVKPKPIIEPPGVLLIGAFTLTVDAITSVGEWDAKSKVFKGVSGTAWLKLDCAGIVPTLELAKLPQGYTRMVADLEVVQRVTHPETEISLLDAYRFNPDVHVGQTLAVDLAVTGSRFHDLARSDRGILEPLESLEHRGDILVSFKQVNIESVPGKKNTGRILRGEVTFPADPPCPREIRLDRDGFLVLITAMTLRPAGATATATLVLPDSIGSEKTCQPARLSLGRVAFTPDCDIYVDRPDGEFGPWLIGDTGLVVTGRGYTVDLSQTVSPAPRPAAWMGVVLHDGTASGSLNPLDSNTGYLAGRYHLSSALITQTGFQGQIDLEARHAFQPISSARLYRHDRQRIPEPGQQPDRLW